MKVHPLTLLPSIAASAVLAFALGVGRVPATADGGGTTTRVSVATDGTQANGSSDQPHISADGRYVAFYTVASNLVAGDTNGDYDVFVHDRQTGQTTRVSVASDGTQGNGLSGVNSISADGRYVAFDSNASNLVPGDTNGSSDVFVHDRQTGQTTRVSDAAPDAVPGWASSFSPSISADGRYVAFSSQASKLVPGDTSGYDDVFVHDRQTGQTARVSVASDGTEGNDRSGYPSISADGRYVAFLSWASNLVPGDTNGYQDVFGHDRQTGQTTRVSAASDGTQGNDRSWYPSVSADGRYVAFDSDAANLVPGDANNCNDVFVHDRQTGQTIRVSVASDGAQGNGGSGFPSISADGRYVAFASGSGNLVPGDTNGSLDVFVHDRQTGQTTRVSVASEGGEGFGGFFSSISADGRYVAFASSASNLVTGDTNGWTDIFVRDRGGIPTDSTPPAAVPDWTVTAVTTDSVTLAWTAPGDDGNTGTATSYDVRYATWPIINDSTWASLSQANGEPPAKPAGSRESFTVSGLLPGYTYWIGLKTADEAGNWSALSNVISATLPMAPNIDLSVDSVSPVQVLEGADMVKNKAMAVKAVIRKAGSGTASNVSVLLDYGGSFASRRFYVADPNNMDSQNALIADNATYPLNFTANEVTRTIYFFSANLTPSYDTFRVSVTVDDLGSIPETNEANNTAISASVPVYDTKYSFS